MSRKKQRKDEAENIKVVIRSRPLNTKELDAGMKYSVDLDLAEGTVTVNHVCGTPDRWTFDGVINNTFNQNDVFVQFIRPMVDSVLDGFNATIFAYGQSGSGKTYTMTGGSTPELQGIIPRSFHYVFNHIRERRSANISYTIRCSFLELYNGKIRDLLAKSQVSLNIKENKDKTFYVADLSQLEVKFEQEMLNYMEEGNIRRQVAATELNCDSSRSHSIFTVCIEMVETTDDGECRTVTSKLNLVDLAGSERQSKTRASGDTLKEGCNINLSLSALGTVIDTIVKGKGHIPFRSSPLTMLLKDSLGGNSKTCMFANINPADANVSETVSTLRFADRAKQIKNKPVIQLDAKDQKIQDLLTRVQELQEKLKAFESNDAPNLEEENELAQERIAVLEGDIDALKDTLASAEAANEERRLLFEKSQVELREELGEELRQKEETNVLLEGRLQMSVQNANDISADSIDLREVLVNFLAESEEVETPFLKGDVKDISVVDFKDALDSLGDVTEDKKALAKEKEKYEEDLLVVREEMKEEVLRLQTFVDKAKEGLKQETQRVAKLKLKLEREKESRRSLAEESRCEVETLQKSLAAAKNAAQTHDTRKAPMEQNNNDTDAMPDDVAAKIETASLLERIKSLEAELNARGKAESTSLSVAQEGIDRAQAKQEAAEMEASKMRQRLAEPCDDDTAVIAMFKREIQVLDAKCSHDTEERAEAARLQEISAADLEKEVRDNEKLRARVQELEAVRDKMREMAHDAPGANPEEVDTAAYWTALEAKVAVYESSANTRDDALEVVRQKCSKDLERQAQRYRSLEEHCERLLDTVTKAHEGDPDASALSDVIKSLRTELRSARVDACAQQQNALTSTSEVTAKQQQLLNLQAKLTEMGSDTLRKGATADRVSDLETRLTKTEGETVLAHGESESHRARLLASQERVAELEAKLTTPAENDTQLVKDLKEELATSGGELQGLRREVNDLTQRVFQERSKARNHTDFANNGNGGAAVHERERQLEEVQEDKQELENEIAHLRTNEEKLRREFDELLNEQAGHTDVVAKMKEELKRAAAQCQEEERAAVKWQKERDAAVGSSSKLQQRLLEKEEALRAMRAMTDNQAQMLEKNRAHEQQLQTDVQNMKKKLDVAASSTNERIQEEQAKWARFQSERMEAASLAHEKALAKKDEDTEQVRKKLRKSQSNVQKVKEKYDREVLEAESLRAQLGDMKEVALRRLREQQNPQVDVDENRDEIQNIIRNSRAAHSRVLDNTDTEEKEKERDMKRRASVKNLKREEMRSAAAKKFESGNDSVSASQQASAAARVRASGSVARYDSRRYRGGSGGATRGSPLEHEEGVHPLHVDNDTPGHGIHRQLSPRAQFNPSSRQREVEERLLKMEVDEPVHGADVQQRGPSTLNPFSRLPTSGTLGDDNAESADTFNISSHTMSMGLANTAPISNEVPEQVNTSVPLPRKHF